MRSRPGRRPAAVLGAAVALGLAVGVGPVDAAANVAGDDGPLPLAPVVAEAPPVDLRLLSSPDFLNADVADLRRGPGFWNPRRSENGINELYKAAIDTILDDWVAQDPAAVLIAGDTVNGRWGEDDQHTGNFGPVRTLEERKAAVRRAARTYYPQFLQRFREHDLDVYVATGDHEYGDNEWPRAKRALAKTFVQEFARAYTLTSDGRPRFKDRPREGPHQLTSYAWRPHPEVQVVSLDVFDITPEAAHVRVDKAQLAWLRSVLRKAQRDGVTWTVVQAHTPILGPVRYAASSNLHYEGGPGSKLWKTFKKYGVDVYLCGEAHAVTATVRDEILQLTHGGAFQWGLTTYALLDFAGDELSVTLNDYRIRTTEADDLSRLWETARGGMKKGIKVMGDPETIGSLVMHADGRVTDRTGILRPYRP